MGFTMYEYVWVVTVEIQDEPSTVMGIFLSEDLAAAHKEVLEHITNGEWVVINPYRVGCIVADNVADITDILKFLKYSESKCGDESSQDDRKHEAKRRAREVRDAAGILSAWISGEAERIMIGATTLPLLPQIPRGCDIQEANDIRNKWEEIRKAIAKAVFSGTKYDPSGPGIPYNKLGSIG